MRLSHFLLSIVVLGAERVWSQSPAVERADAPQQKTTVVVMPFEFAAPLPAQPRVAPPHRPSMWPPLLALPSGIGRAPLIAPRLPHASVPVSAEPYPAEGGNSGVGEAIGIGVADLLVARLLEVPSIRVVERHRLDFLMGEQWLAKGDTTARDTTANLLRARYIISGSITRFSTEERRGLGGLGGPLGLGALGFKRAKTQVALTARIIDAVTGEIIASITGDGISTKGGSILIGGIGGGVGGGVTLGSSEFRASALGQATERAVDALVRDIVAKQGRLSGG
jgi:curli biogenesis system outer membrane secretion channel CsgG